MKTWCLCVGDFVFATCPGELPAAKAVAEFERRLRGRAYGYTIRRLDGDHSAALTGPNGPEWKAVAEIPYNHTDPRLQEEGSPT